MNAGKHLVQPTPIGIVAIPQRHVNIGIIASIMTIDYVNWRLNDSRESLSFTDMTSMAQQILVQL
jgi:hypothetical protein